MLDAAGEMSTALRQWHNALLVIRLASSFPKFISSIRVCSAAGPVRDMWPEHLDKALAPDLPRVRIPFGVSGEQLAGGTDIEASLLAGRPIQQSGLLERAQGGLAYLPMAERFPQGHAWFIANAIDQCKVCPSQSFLTIALDEAGGDGPFMTDVLADRMCLVVRLDGISIRDAFQEDIAPNQTDIEPSDVDVSDEITNSIASLTSTMPGGGMRLMQNMVQVCRFLSAFSGNSKASAEDAAMAISLCLGLQLQPQPEAKQQEEQSDQSTQEQNDEMPPSEPDRDHEQRVGTDSNHTEFETHDIGELDVAIAQASNAIRDMMEGSQKMPSGSHTKTGVAGDSQTSSNRGRPVGLSTKPIRIDARLDIVATLRTAIPMQRLRNPQVAQTDFRKGMKIRILPSDFRFKRHQHPTESAAIFAVDASGSTALSRLAEAKGAIELLLNDCYVRRDTVALVSFRGRRAQTLLEPTRSLVRAKRSLAQLPGGGPTPLADGIRLSLELAESAKRRGQSPLIVFMTDGSGNIALDGRADRKQANSDARDFAFAVVEKGYRTLFIDIGKRPRETARDLASAMQAEYCPLPHVSAQAVSGLVERHLRG